MKSEARSYAATKKKTAYGAFSFIFKNLKIEGLKKKEVRSQESGDKKVEKKKKSEESSNLQINKFITLTL